MKEKVLFFDIDGTLVDNTYGVHEVPEGVKRELKRIQNDGHKLFICSGRPKAMITSSSLIWVLMVMSYITAVISRLMVNLSLKREWIQNLRLRQLICLKN